MSRTCGTCRFRGEPVEGQLNDDFQFKVTSYFLCDRIKFTPYDRPAGAHALVTDGSGYWAALCVETDFGCNLWEKAE